MNNSTNQIIEPTHTNIPTPGKKTTKKSTLIIVGIVIFIVFIAPIIALNIYAHSEQIVGGDRGQSRFEIDENAPMILNIYANMYENITITDLDFLIKKTNYATKKEVDDIDKDIVYLSSVTSTIRKDNCFNGEAYIKYRVDRQEGLTEEQEPNKWAIDIEYHECIQGKDTYIMQTLDHKYRNYTGTLTIDYDTKEDAILNQLSVRNK